MNEVHWRDSRRRYQEKKEMAGEEGKNLRRGRERIERGR